MKYTIEVEDGKAIETLEIGGNTFTKTTLKKSFGSMSCDKDFSEQLEEAGIVNDELLDCVYDKLDGFFVQTMLDIEALE